MLKRKRASNGPVIAAPEKEALAAGCRKELAGLLEYFKEVSGHKMQIDGGGNLSTNAMIGCLLEESNLGLSNPDADVLEDESNLSLWCWEKQYAYVDSLKLAANGKEVWVFDINETTLSNLPYYIKHGFGDDCVFLEGLSGAKNLELIADYIMGEDQSGGAFICLLLLCAGSAFLYSDKSQAITMTMPESCISIVYLFFGFSSSNLIRSTNMLLISPPRHAHHLPPSSKFRFRQPFTFADNLRPAPVSSTIEDGHGYTTMHGCVGSYVHSPHGDQ
ncbi:hypothetical protein ZWY2020_051644 [Hordeum vulgare]|nr:hypothetical protein ZWY2020_051644 [Hordeum vulgare]